MEPQKARWGLGTGFIDSRLHLYVPLHRFRTHTSGTALTLLSQICRHIPWQIVGQAVMSLLSLAELSGKSYFIFQQDNFLCVNGRINKELKNFFFRLQSGAPLHVQQVNFFFSYKCLSSGRGRNYWTFACHYNGILKASWLWTWGRGSETVSWQQTKHSSWQDGTCNRTLQAMLNWGGFQKVTNALCFLNLRWVLPALKGCQVMLSLACFVTVSIISFSSPV